VDYIAAEDTRRTRKLLTHYGISTATISFHQHSAGVQLDRLLTLLQGGKNVALVSDAGTPGISDPGQALVAACIAENIPVDPLPGPCAAVTALSASGYPLASFTFHGFLPRKGLDAAVAALANCSHPVVVYESPRRVRMLLEHVAAHMPQREVLLARELTKFHQQLLRGTAVQLLQELTPDLERGEFTVVLGPWTPAPKEWSEDQLLAKVEDYLAQSISTRDAVALVSAETGCSRRHLYILVNKKKQDT
jgi:16S rRNA (cytidine1402-2'-O)-methyltransferase